ncbi:MAG: hypothetical protein M1829_006182 [Trizodia sp. TS-e1964]|nr:MAG: hypothetical protein M1829_006182 [Trizodia sp. TS-e1964]
MEAERIFHEKSKSYKPEQPVKPTDYWIAILHHEKSPHAIESGLDFLWVRGNKKITVEKLIKSYKSTAFSGPATDLDIHLCLGLSSRSLGADVNLGLLDTFADQVITLRALRNSALNAPENILRPLNPVINPATSKPSSSSDHLNKMDQKLFPSEWKLPFSPKKPHLTNNVNSEPIPMKLDNAPNQDKDDFDSWMANTLHKAETDKSSDNDEEDADSGEDDMGDDDDYHYYGGRYSHRYYSEEDMEDEEMEEEDQSEGQNDEIKHNTSFSSAPNYNALYGNATASRTIFPAMSQPVNQQAALSSYHTMHPNSATVPRIQPYESHNNGFPVLPGAAAPRPNDLSYYPVVPKVEASGDYIHSEYDNIFQRPGTIKNEDKSQVQPPVAGIKTEDQAIPDFSFDNQPNRQQMLESKQQIHNLFADASPEILEKAVKKGVDLLDLLSIPLDQKKDQSNDAAQWLTQIGKLLP